METALQNIQQNQESERPAVAPFLLALESFQSKERALTPIQRLHGIISQMKQFAEGGELQSWQSLRQQLSQALEDTSLDSVRELEIQVEVAEQEMTLFLRASQKTLSEAKELENRAKVARDRQDEDEAKEHLAKSHRLNRLGQQLQDQLLAKKA